MARKGTRSGWFGESRRHSLASQGIKTAKRQQKRRLPRAQKWSKRVEVKKGALRGWSKDLPQSERLKILADVVNKDGYGVAIKRLNYLVNVGADPETDRKAKSDMEWLQKAHANGWL